MGMLPKYYLETSSILTAGVDLQSVVPVTECYTSAFVLFELVTGLTADTREYGARKSSIVSVVDSGLDIRLVLPLDRIKMAFPVLENKTDHMHKFWKIIDCVSDSESKAEFESLLADRSLTDYFKRLMREHDDIVGAALAVNESDLRQQASAFVNVHWPLEEEKGKRQVLRKVVDSVFADRVERGCPDVIRGLARMCTLDSIPGATDNEIKRAYDSYDGSLSMYIRAYNLALRKWQFDGYEAERNDFADVLHLLYLDKDSVLVSEERDSSLMILIAHEIGIPLKRLEELQGN